VKKVPNPQIMIVEDERIIAEYIQSSLKTLGYYVGDIASSGEEAIAKAGNLRPDLVLMDIKIRGEIDGIDVADVLRTKFDIPVVYLTAYSDAELLNRAKKTEPLGYIIKPFGESELHTVIEIALYKNEMEKKLKKSDKKFRMLFENASEGIMYIDRAWNIIDINPRALEILGCESEEIMGQNFMELLPTFSMESSIISTAFENILLGPSQFKIEWELKNKKGTKQTLLAHISLIKENNEVVGISLILQDITARRYVEDILRERAEIIDAMNDGVLIFDLDGKVISANCAFCNLFELKSQEVIGRSFMELPGMERQKSQDIEKLLSLFAEVWEKDMIHPVELTIIGKGNRRIPVSVSSGKILDSKGNPIRLITVIRDITERKLAEEELIRSEKLAGIGTLASGIAHEINNPLAAILGYAEIIQYQENPELMKEFAKQIVYSAERAADIILWLSKYSREAKETLISDVDLNQVINKSIDIITRTRSTSNIDVKANLKTIPAIKGNPIELRQIFLNLLYNAMDSLQNEGNIDIITRADNGFVEVNVIDSGIGIPKENINRIFEPFYSTKEKGRYAGLGLYIVSMLVKKHKGEISVESEQGVGTTLTLKFPCS
jgi:PAS domain S-box-containing protein